MDENSNAGRDDAPGCRASGARCPRPGCKRGQRLCGQLVSVPHWWSDRDVHGRGLPLPRSWPGAVQERVYAVFEEYRAVLNRRPDVLAGWLQYGVSERDYSEWYFWGSRLHLGW